MNPTIIFATIALAIGSFMNVLDMTIVNVSLTHIAGDFAIAPDQGTWVITSYAVAEAIFLPLIGWLTKRLGIIKQYLGATLLFTLASMLCGISPNFETLLAMRVIQGIVGASMIPLSQTLMLRLYPKDKKGVALGIWSMTIVIAPVIGPILGGWITDTASWRWCFYINLPFGILSSFVVYHFLKKDISKEKTVKEPIDLLGFLFLAIGVGSLQLMLDKGNDLDWFSSPTIVILGILAFVFIGILIIWEWYHKTPVVNVRLFLDRNFCVGSFSLMFSVLAYFSGVVAIPLWLQNYMGYTAFLSGRSTATLGLGIMIVAPILGKKIDHLDARKVAALGFLALALATFVTSNYSPQITPEYIGFTRFLNGFGVGIFFISLNTLTLSTISDENLASASGIYNFMRNIGSSLGTSLVIPAWNHFKAFHHEIMSTAINTSNPNLNPALAHSSQYLAMINMEITKQSAIMGINDILIGSGLIALVLIPFLFLAKSTKYLNNKS
ncbi:DHA2 family efflux MFS transporter permease subunit [uncultured Cetobacterium sp.]|uniref:DHA2 family efflux MFS transporter permease subunit n=2 Tax=uncultured Cetobacterium sp. TaxID=527638 RepID=UPI00260FEBB2|nr:DHA2 family efflux MFS transporter permease subunit [uncultured Cetobacterium sp.]